MEVEQPPSFGMPDRMARAPLRRGNRSSASACRRDCLELDVSIPVFQERDPLAVRRPQRPRLVPLALDEPSDPAPPKIEDPDVEMIVDVRDECKVGALRGPWSRRPRIAANRALRLGEVDDFLHATVQVDQPDVLVT